MANSENRHNLHWFIGQANYYLSLFSGILLVLLCISTSYGVFRRYALNSPEPYSYEIGCMFLLASFVLAVSAVEWRDRFIKVDLLLTHLPKTIQTVITNFLSPICGLLLVFVLVWQGGIDAIHAFNIGQTSMSVWREPLYPIKFLIPTGYGLLGLTLIAKLFYGITWFSTKKQD
jgi:TRAP-type mannitol/chloroaromatic compound transport system permease small subunit